MKWQTKLAEWRQVHHKVRQHWMLPKVDHGKAQIPYFHGQEQTDLLNRNIAIARLRVEGSVAAPGFMQPEGIIVWHHAARSYYKVLLENDDKHKGEA